MKNKLPQRLKKNPKLFEETKCFHQRFPRKIDYKKAMGDSARVTDLRL